MSKIIYFSGVLVLAIAMSSASAFTLKLNDSINVLGCFQLSDSNTPWFFVPGILKKDINSFANDVTSSYSGEGPYQIKIYPASDAAPVPATCKFSLDNDQFKTAKFGVYKDHCTLSY